MTYKKALTVIPCLFTVLAFDSGIASAQTTTCKIDQITYESNAGAYPGLDMRRTNITIATTMTDILSLFSFGQSPGNVLNCSYKALTEIEDNQPTNLINNVENMCGEELNEPVDCSGFSTLYKVIETSDSLDRGLSYEPTRTGGSVLAVINTLEGIRRTEPVPVNLAYFWNDQIKSIPFLNKSFAADVRYPSASLISVVLSLWKTSRNIALGLMAVIMIITGISIMMRKKLSPQLSVTVQYALPRVALAVILILFSFPIGAVLGQSMQYLDNLARGAICSGGDVLLCDGGIAALMGGLFIGAALVMIPFHMVGAFGLVGLTVVNFILMIMKLAIGLKGLILYFKLASSIVLSPIFFAIGSIPSQEDKTIKYLKQWLAYVLGYVGMYAYVTLVEVIIMMLIESPGAVFSGGTLLTAALTVFASPLLLLFGYIQAMKVPGKVESFLIGEPPRPRQGKK